MMILVTGFEPFGGEAINPSWEAVRRLNRDTGDACIERLWCRQPTQTVSGR
jgi:pyroglutamyl-peptidase